MRSWGSRRAWSSAISRLDHSGCSSRIPIGACRDALMFASFQGFLHCTYSLPTTRIMGLISRSVKPEVRYSLAHRAPRIVDGPEGGTSMLTRRDFLAAGTAAAALAASPSRALAQTPKRGGTIAIRAWDPPHFNASLAHAYKTHVPISLTHSRLHRSRAGAGVKPGSLVIQGDLAESWTQPSDTTYVFRLRRGVRFHAKPPVNGRELTAEDVKFTFERMLTEAGSNASMYRAIAKVEAADRYTVRFTLSDPFAWFLDMVASPMAGGIVARECVEKWGDLKKPEAVIGTGPWMLESYRPNVSLTMVRHPGYFVPGLPYIHPVELLVDEDNAPRKAAVPSGRYDLGWEFPGTINRTDWVQIKDRLRQKRPNLKTAEFPSNVMSHISMRTDQKPYSDVRVRHAISLALDRQAIIDQPL